MNDWTDAEIGALLTETFRSREQLADQVTALRIADEVPDRRRSWPVIVAAAASVAILVTGTVYVVVRPGRSPEVSAPTENPSGIDPTHGVTDADNYRAAEKESERALRLAPLPPGAVRLQGKPAGWPDAGYGMSPSDESLTRTAWYSVPLDADEVQEFLFSHVPDGMARDDGYGNSVGVRNFDYTTPQPRDPAAYTGPSLLVQWYDLGSRTAIRFDVMLASRHARTPATYLTGTVTSVDIGRTVEKHTGTQTTRTLPTVRLSADEDAGRVARLVDGFNGLYGAVVSTTLHSCPPQTRTTTYRFTFHTTDGEVSYRWIANGCDPEFEVMRDGRRVGPNLDPGDLEDTVAKVLAQAPK